MKNIPSAIMVSTFGGLSNCTKPLKYWKIFDFGLSRNEPSGWQKHGGSGTKGQANIFFTFTCFVIVKSSSQPNISRVPYACWIFQAWVDLFFSEKFSNAKFENLLFLIGSSNPSTIFWYSFTNVSLLEFHSSNTVKR